MPSTGPILFPPGLEGSRWPWWLGGLGRGRCLLAPELRVSLTSEEKPDGNLQAELRNDQLSSGLFLQETPYGDPLGKRCFN